MQFKKINFNNSELSIQNKNKIQILNRSPPVVEQLKPNFEEMKSPQMKSYFKSNVSKKIPIVDNEEKNVEETKEMPIIKIPVKLIFIFFILFLIEP